MPLNCGLRFNCDPRRGVVVWTPPPVVSTRVIGVMTDTQERKDRPLKGLRADYLRTTDLARKPALDRQAGGIRRIAKSPVARPAARGRVR